MAEVRRVPMALDTDTLYSTRFGTNGSRIAASSYSNTPGSTALISSAVFALATPIELPRWTGLTMQGKVTSPIAAATASGAM